ADVIEYKKFRFWSEKRGVGNASAFQIVLRFFGEAARVAVVWFARNRVDDSADQCERRFGIKNIDPGRGRIGNDEHVGGVDHLPSTNARAIEAEAVGKNIFVVFRDGGR